MKLFYQPHPNIDPIVMQSRDYLDYLYQENCRPRLSLPISVQFSVPYTKTLERIDDRHLGSELARLNARSVEMVVKCIFYFDYWRAQEELGDNGWFSDIYIEIINLNGQQAERDSLLINKLEYYYYKMCRRELKQHRQLTEINSSDADQFKWSTNVKLIDEREQYLKSVLKGRTIYEDLLSTASEH